MRIWQIMTSVSLALSLVACFHHDDKDKASNTPTPLSCAIGQTEQNGQCVSVCTASAEKSWVRAHLDDVYLWYHQIIDVPAANYPQAVDYFDALLVKQEDRFSFTANAADIDQFQEEGVDIGYGMTWVNDPVTGAVRVSLVEPNSPAAALGIQRGDQLLSVNGMALDVITESDFAAAIQPQTKGIQTQFRIFHPANGTIEDVSITATNIRHTPVQSTVITAIDGKKVGYILFNDHITVASAQLVAAVNQLKQAQVEDLVLDLRYNSGGYLTIASELATMIAGNTRNQVFATFQYNNKHRQDDESSFFEQRDENNQLLPTLNLKRVFVLTSGTTCSASEALMNSLEPRMSVIRIGQTTCGKPYGFLQENHCDTAYFAVRFKTVNALGVSVPTTGLTPQCEVVDNLDYALASTDDDLMAAALTYRMTGACPVASLRTARSVSHLSSQSVELKPWRNNLIMKATTTP